MAALGEVIEQRWPLLAGIVILWLLHKFIQYYRLRRFGGPWVTHFTDLPNSVKTYLGESDSWYRSISERYGMSPVFCSRVKQTGLTMSMATQAPSPAPAPTLWSPRVPKSGSMSTRSRDTSGRHGSSSQYGWNTDETTFSASATPSCMTNEGSRLRQG